MKPYYIILTESGERLDLANGYEFNPNEWAWKEPEVGFYFEEDDPEESYCYTPDHDERFDDEDETTTATTLGFIAYDEAGNIICQGEGGAGFWL